MIKSLSIENFRCFHQSYFEGFGRVNLLGGKNNSGKTSLLEAILLANVPTESSVNFLQQVRTENPNIFREHPELAWGNFFYKFDKLSTIKLNAEIGKTTTEVNIICSEYTKRFVQQYRIGEEDKELIKIVDSATFEEIGESNLELKFIKPNTKQLIVSKVSFNWIKNDKQMWGPKENYPFLPTLDYSIKTNHPYRGE